MRGLNNEQLAVMREIGPPGAPPKRRATKREAAALHQLERRRLVYPEWSEDGGGFLARMTKMGRLLFDLYVSRKIVKGIGL